MESLNMTIRSLESELFVSLNKRLINLLIHEKCIIELLKMYLVLSCLVVCPAVLCSVSSCPACPVISWCILLSPVLLCPAVSYCTKIQIREEKYYSVYVFYNV
jgi:hypothetical protein